MKEQVKEITELTPEELEVVNSICQKALKDYFGDQIVAWYRTIYNYLPASDEDAIADFSKMKKLMNPIAVVSVTGIGLSYQFDKIKRELKGEVAKLEASYYGKSFRVSKSFVMVEPGGGGGSIHMSYDKVTIIPCKVTIKS